jgi:hypothetical protein
MRGTRGTRLLVHFIGIVVIACITLIAAYAIAGFAEFLFRGHFVAFIGDGHGVHNFGILTVGIAIDILRGDLDGVEEQAGLARVDAGAEEGRCDLEDGYLDGGGILQHGELEVIKYEVFWCGHGMRAVVEIAVSQLAESRRLASFTVGLDMTTKLEHRVPPPILWAQNPCFLEVTRRVALQNIENNEVPCKIFQRKELQAVSASGSSFRLTDGAKRMCRDDV